MNSISSRAAFTAFSVGPETVTLAIDTSLESLDLFKPPEKKMVGCTNGKSFSRMRSEGSRFIWGSGGEAVFAECCVGVRNRPQPSATVRVTAARLSTVASASGVVPKACQVDSVSAVILVFAEEVSV